MGSSGYQPWGVLGPTSQLLSLQLPTWQTQSVSTLPYAHLPRQNTLTSNYFLQLILTVVTEVITPFRSFSLARHNPLMVHSTHAPAS